MEKYSVFPNTFYYHGNMSGILYSIDIGMQDNFDIDKYNS
jgi:hypothetical protein